MKNSAALALSTLVALGATVLAGSCSSDADDSSSSSTNAGGGSSESSATNQGGAGPGSGGGLVGSTGVGGDDGCVDEEAEASIITRPVDVIFVIDNSGSMSDEIYEVEAQISENFANIIDSAMPPVDYRVVMVAQHGRHSQNDVCISEPLSGIPEDPNDPGHCPQPPPVAPVNGPRFFHHSERVASHDALCRLLDSYTKPGGHGLQPDGYQEVLREDAFKVFVVITDDGVSCSFDGQTYNDGNNIANGEVAGDRWDEAITTLSPTHFGTQAERNYVFHSIIALAPYDTNDLTLPHPPSAPITTALCTPSARDPGTGYQQLSRITGGLRYPTCGLDYTTIFQAIAAGVIEGAAVPCEFGIPESGSQGEVDIDSARVRYTPGDGGESQLFDLVDGPGSCAPGKFYLDLADQTVVLCPDTCAVVQADPDAQIRVVFDCTQTAN